MVISLLEACFSTDMPFCTTSAGRRASACWSARIARIRISTTAPKIREKPAEPAKPSLSLNPLKGLMPAKKPAEPEVKAAPASIAGQIDEILQEILEKAPEGTPPVRLMDDPREGVVVWVGAQKFLGVDTITDPLARKLVQTAVAEWERRNSGMKP